MSWKWMLVIAVLVILVVLYITGRKSVHHEITIEASADKVWQVLMDMEAYDDWNPTMKLVKGKVEVGGKVTYQITQDADNVSEIPAKVQQIVANKLLNQSGGMPIILTYDHRYILESSEHQSNVTIHEDYRGIGVHFWNPKPVEEAYARLNRALKKRVESLP
ncbi:MAG: SRPBCC domain-containing protein [Bacteroidota bacterium]